MQPNSAAHKARARQTHVELRRQPAQAASVSQLRHVQARHGHRHRCIALLSAQWRKRDTQATPHAAPRAALPLVVCEGVVVGRLVADMVQKLLLSRGTTRHVRRRRVQHSTVIEQ